MPAALALGLGFVVGLVVGVVASVRRFPRSRAAAGATLALALFAMLTAVVFVFGFLRRDHGARSDLAPVLFLGFWALGWGFVGGAATRALRTVR